MEDYWFISTNSYQTLVELIFFKTLIIYEFLAFEIKIIYKWLIFLDTIDDVIL